MILGLDLDGVLSDSWHHAVYEELVEERGEKRDFGTFWSTVEQEELPKTLWEHYTQCPIYYTRYQVPKRVPDTINLLAYDFDEIWYITHREEAVRSTTLWWLHVNGFPFENNLRLSFEPKDITIRELGCDFYVEDKAYIIESLRNITNVIIRRRPWNAGIKDLPTIDDITELPRVIKEIN